MTRVAVTYSPEVGGSSVISLKESFAHVSSDVIDADYRKMMHDIPKDEFDSLYSTEDGRQRLFAHAKAKAMELLKEVDVLALSGNSAMIDPALFNQARDQDQKYDLSRTIAELALVHIATNKGMPVLGVCGGHQVIAVYGGGEISDLSADKLDKQRYMDYDAIKFNKDSMIAQIIGGKKIHNEVKAIRKKLDAKRDELNSLSKKVNALKQLNRLKEAGKLNELDQLDALKTSEVQELLAITGLKVKEDLLDLCVFVEELGNLGKLTEKLGQEAHELDELRKELEGGTHYYEEEFFGAHNQVVSKLGTAIKQTATASDDESSEAAESEFGVPIITTQFHPEVGAKGFPNAQFFYKKTEAEQEMDLNVFRSLDQAGDVYRKKKTAIDELNQFKPKETLEDKAIDLTPNIKPADILKARQKPQEQDEQSSSKQEKASFFGQLISAITSFFKAIGSDIKETVRKTVGKFARKEVSDSLTKNLVSKQRKKEKEHSSSGDLGVEKDKVAISPSSFSMISRDLNAKAPSTILRETPAQLWTKQDDLDETVVNKSTVDKTDEGAPDVSQEIGYATARMY